MNMQNLTRGGELRLSILAPPGHVVAVQDSGQIECRVNGWLWGQHDLLDAFKDADKGIGRDAYCNFADLVYGREITKADKTERFVGKVCVLGLGFQMGAPKLQITFAKGALGGPPVYFELDKCKMIVNAYRQKNYRIQEGWAVCKRIIEDMAEGRTGSHGPINWEANTIWLPNGMALKYPDLKKAMGDKGWEEWTYQSGKQRKKIYGGLLCENIVQALARIIVGWQMLQISRKYRVVMTTHDEVVAIAKKAQAEACIKYMAKWMSTAPAWCSDIPLNSEGGFDDRYSK
jgi:DNA polymerase